MSDGLRKLSINMAAAAGGSEEAAQTFSRLGVQISANGKLRDADAVFGDIAEKFKTSRVARRARFDVAWRRSPLRRGDVDGKPWS
jgi:hypothetical protein